MKPVFEQDYQYKVDESKRPKKSKKSVSTSFKSLEIDWCGYSNSYAHRKQKTNVTISMGRVKKNYEFKLFYIEAKIWLQKEKKNNHTRYRKICKNNLWLGARSSLWFTHWMIDEIFFFFYIVPTHNVFFLSNYYCIRIFINISKV